MRTFIITFFILFLIELGGKIMVLARDDYPRLVKKSDDYINFVIFVWIVVWSGYLLF